MPEARSRTLLWILIGGGAFFLFVLAVFTLVYMTLHAGGTDAGITSSFGDRIGVVDLDGVILSPQPVVGELKKFADDSSIKAIIIHVNSPGGGVAAKSSASAPRRRSASSSPLKPSAPAAPTTSPPLPTRFTPTRAASSAPSASLPSG